MILNISYVKPCSEKNSLAARLDFDGKVDMEKMKSVFETKYSEKLGIVKFAIGKIEVMLSENHIDIRNAGYEHEILKIVEKMKPFLTDTV
jgi:hypothetical protein